MKIQSSIVPSTCHKQFAIDSFSWVHEACSIVIVQVINNVEDEKTFSTSTFMKFKLRNRLVKYLNIEIHMFAQDFFLLRSLFSLQIVIAYWSDSDKVKIIVNAYLLKVVVTICFLFIVVVSYVSTCASWFRCFIILLWCI
jgi:hypothetical protein